MLGNVVSFSGTAEESVPIDEVRPNSRPSNVPTVVLIIVVVVIVQLGSQLSGEEGFITL